jgi:adenylate kinase
MISLEVEKEELIKRLLSRGAVSGRADDANTDIIENRINEYNNKTYPLKAYYQKQDKLRSVHGIGSVDEIFSNICGVIDELS